jgi:hypothetical protein
MLARHGDNDERAVEPGLRERVAVLQVRSADLLAAPGLRVPFLVRQDPNEAGEAWLERSPEN